ncbi:Protein of unknown function (DUF2637) [Frankia sp. EI5c]|uniref:DUF2637 domain-containing protein n=1 Tax=Frankia sp. EI5c TaxID=683316 RepID=UPI0007C228F3|nr:DUF2637 domain-containing protein [Frankia sp. EI5c]OAA19313.1 Protein of unknown function (DUF2637) [Frankia sp. EI5c]
MTLPNQPTGSPVNRAGRWLVWVALGAVATIAMFVSYRHMVGLLLAHGEDPLNARLLPFTVDAPVVVVAVVLFKGARGSTRRLAWSAFLLCMAASVAANVAHGEQSVTGWIISAWPPVILVLISELVLRLVAPDDSHDSEHDSATTPDRWPVAAATRHDSPDDSHDNPAVEAPEDAPALAPAPRHAPHHEVLPVAPDGQSEATTAAGPRAAGHDSDDTRHDNDTTAAVAPDDTADDSDDTAHDNPPKLAVVPRQPDDTGCRETTARDIAERHGVSVRTAQRWLAKGRV